MLEQLNKIKRRIHNAIQEATMILDNDNRFKEKTVELEYEIECAMEDYHEQEKKALEDEITKLEDAFGDADAYCDAWEYHARKNQKKANDFYDKNKVLMELLEGLYRQEYPGDMKFFDADFKRYVDRGLPDYKGIKDEK